MSNINVVPFSRVMPAGNTQADSQQPTKPPVSSVESHESDVGKLVLQHQAGLRIFARYLTGNRDQADDLVQDAIIRALIAADKFTPGTNFRAWIFTIARNLFYTERRKAWNKHTPLHEMLHEPATRATQEQALEFCDFRRAFWELRSEQREALIHVGIDGLSYQAAAAAADCAVGTVKSRVSRARQDIRSLLGERRLAVARPAIRPIVGDHLIEALQQPPSLKAKPQRSRPMMPVPAAAGSKAPRPVFAA
jgi:RNA polymerase sigma-70 factor (ECF subfamily)